VALLYGFGPKPAAGQSYTPTTLVSPKGLGRIQSIEQYNAAQSAAIERRLEAKLHSIEMQAKRMSVGTPKRVVISTSAVDRLASSLMTASGIRSGDSLARQRFESRLYKLAQYGQDYMALGGSRTSLVKILGYDPVMAYTLFNTGTAAGLEGDALLRHVLQGSSGGSASGLGITLGDVVHASEGIRGQALRQKLTLTPGGMISVKGIPARHTKIRARIAQMNAQLRYLDRSRQLMARNYLAVAYEHYRDEALSHGHMVTSRDDWIQNTFSQKFAGPDTELRQLGIAMGISANDIIPQTSVEAGHMRAQAQQIEGDLKRELSDMRKADRDLAHAGIKPSGVRIGSLDPKSAVSPHYYPDVGEFKGRASKPIHYAGIMAGVGVTADYDQVIEAIASAYSQTGDLPKNVIQGPSRDRVKYFLRHLIQEHTPIGPAREASPKVAGGIVGNEVREPALSGYEGYYNQQPSSETQRAVAMRQARVGAELAKMLKEVKREQAKTNKRAKSQIIHGSTIGGVARALELVRTSASGMRYSSSTGQLQALQRLVRPTRPTMSVLEANPSGRLYDSIRVETHTVGGGASIQASSSSPYATFVEEGFFQNFEVLKWLPVPEKIAETMPALGQKVAGGLGGGTEALAIPMRQLGEYPYFQAIVADRRAHITGLQLTHGDKKWFDSFRDYQEQDKVGFATRQRFYGKGQGNTPFTMSPSQGGQPFGRVAGAHMFQRGFQEFSQVVAGRHARFAAQEFEKKTGASVKRVSKGGKK
jgi:hypothetical protein